MKIMRLLSSLHHDEAERGIFHLTRALLKKGHECIVVSSADHDNELVERLVRDGCTYVQMPLQKKSWFSLFQVLPLYFLIKKQHPDIIHVHSRTPALLVQWALKLMPADQRPKLISTVYGFYKATPYAKAMMDADHIITVSDSVVAYLKKHYPHLSPTQLTRIYRGVDTQKFIYRHHPSVFWVRRTFAEFKALEHKKWLLFPTTIGEDKGQEWLFDIVGNLRKDFPNIHVIVMDDDSNTSLYYEEFMQRMTALDLTGYFTFIGKREDTREWLAASNVVLGLANFPESIGMTVLQALHLGTPVVGWDTGAYSEILHELYPQGLVKQHNAKILCKSLKSQLQNVCRPAMTMDFTLKHMVDETIKVYKKVAASNDNLA